MATQVTKTGEAGHGASMDEAVAQDGEASAGQPASDDAGREATPSATRAGPGAAEAGAGLPGLIRTTAEAYEESALPCRRGVTLAENGAPAETAEAQPLPEALTSESPAAKGAAQWAYERVLLYLQNFERQLDGEHEIALGFAGSDAGVLRIEGVGFFDPDILTFYGRDEEGMRTQLIQHVSQLNLLLRAVPKLTPDDTPPRRFGFELQPPAAPRPSASSEPSPPTSQSAEGADRAVTGQAE